MNYFNSTLERKMGKCFDCGIDAYVTAGRCTFCYSTYRKKIMLERQKEKSKVRSLIQNPENKSMLVKAGKVVDANLELWYKFQMSVNERICDNCGKSLEHYNEWAWRSSQNHIVDKSPLNGCPSVATHTLNNNVLGMWCCHGQWGTSFLNQSKMPCFAKAQEKFLLFSKFIAPDELKKVNPLLFQP